jgi:hypothetical protein
MPIEIDPNNFPHQIHADVVGAQIRAFPTHTHGLNEIGIPELFINATCFGPENNARAINYIVSEIAKDDAIIEKLKNKEEVEFELGDENDMRLMIRPVENTHMGVVAAYPTEEQRDGIEVAQLYVKGDDHVLAEEYFREAYMISIIPELSDPCCPNCDGYEEDD